MNIKIREVMNKAIALFIVLFFIAGCSNESIIEDNTGYTTLPDGKKIPIANLSVREVNSNKVIVANITSSTSNSVDTARFYGIRYSEDIASVSFQLPEGASISPTPPNREDSIMVEVNGTQKWQRNYWKKLDIYTITTKDNASYQIVFKLEDFISTTTEGESGNEPDPNEPDPNEPGTLFIDLFNGSNPIPDTDVWKLCTYANNAWAQHFQHVEGYENVKIEDGFLKLKANKENGQYKNGGIRTHEGFPKNSRVEIKAKLTKKVRGGFPAIWQMPINGTVWPTAGEIDIMEWVQGAPNRVYQTLHYKYDKPDNTASVSPVKDVTEWQLYAVERTDEAVTFFINGEETMRYSNEGVAQKYPFNQWDYDIILNFSLGGMLNGNLTWAGAIFDEDLPGEMWVDWVRVTEIAN